MVARPDFKFGGNLQMRLEVASNIVQFYKTVGRAITNTIMKWDSIIKDFKKEWEIMVKRKGENVLDAKKTSKALPIRKWMEYLERFLHGTVCEKKTPLYCVIRESESVTVVALPMMRGES